MPPIIAIYGATASGKSALAIALAQAINAEIISVDSAQVYLNMDIGTAKPDRKTQQTIPHHLIDLIEPHQEYSVAQFIQDCQSSIQTIQKRNKAVILCGGTMLYFHRLFIGLSELPKSNPKVREELHQQWQKGPQKIHQRLYNIDPISAQKIHPNDSQRVIRALEIGITYGPLSRLQTENQARPILQPDLNIMINVNERADIHQRIEARFKEMLEQGLLDEVKKLYQNNELHINLPSMRSVGYRQFWQHHDQKLSYQEAYDKTLTATRQLAKRQITWSKTLCTLANTHLLEHNDKQALNKALKLYQSIA